MKKRLFPIIFFLFLSFVIVLPAGAQELDLPRPPLPPIPPDWNFEGLTIEYQRVDVEIDDQVATTHIDQLFVNNGDGSFTPQPAFGLGAVILEREIARYRERNQAPLLKRALLPPRRSASPPTPKAAPLCPALPEGSSDRFPTGSSAPAHRGRRSLPHARARHGPCSRWSRSRHRPAAAVPRRRKGSAHRPAARETERSPVPVSEPASLSYRCCRETACSPTG